MCILCTELANREQEEQEEAESEFNSDIQSNVSPSHEHISDQSQKLVGSSPDELYKDQSADHLPADHLTWNGTKMTLYANINSTLPLSELTCCFDNCCRCRARGGRG